MAKRSRSTFQKHYKEQARQQKQQAKAARRLEAKQPVVDRRVAREPGEIDARRLTELVDEFHRGELTLATHRQTYRLEIRSRGERLQPIPRPVTIALDTQGGETVTKAPGA